MKRLTTAEKVAAIHTYAAAAGWHKVPQLPSFFDMTPVGRALRELAAEDPHEREAVQYQHPRYPHLQATVTLLDGKVMGASVTHGRFTHARTLIGVVRYLATEADYARIEADEAAEKEGAPA